MAGFVGKLYLFAAVIKQQFYFLALVGVLNSVVSAFYYFRIIRTMFLDQPEGNEGPIIVSRHNGALLYGLSILTIALGVYWEPVWGLADRSLSFFVGTV
jgi:NADH-quinone oxidoreductase subunit N